MSKTNNMRLAKNIRWQLLATVSAAALLASAYGAAKRKPQTAIIQSSGSNWAVSWSD